MGAGWFCEPRRERSPTPAEAARRLREIEALYQKRMVYLENEMKKLRDQAKHLVLGGNPRTAKNLLRERMRRDKQFDTLEHYNNTIGAIRAELEQQILNVETVGAIRDSSRVMADIQKKVRPEDVERLLENVQDQVEVSQEVLRTIAEAGQNMHEVQIGAPVDEEELERELVALMEEDLAGAVASAPRPPPSNHGEDREELERLRVWMDASSGSSRIAPSSSPSSPSRGPIPVSL